MLLPHAQTLAQARSYLAALADRASTIDASSAYERVLHRTRPRPRRRLPTADTEGLTDDRAILLAVATQRSRSSSSTASTRSPSSSSSRCSTTHTTWTAPDVRRDRRRDAHGVRGTSAPAPGSAPARRDDARGARGTRRTDPDATGRRVSSGSARRCARPAARVLQHAAGTAEPVPVSRHERLPADRSQRTGARARARTRQQSTRAPASTGCTGHAERRTRGRTTGASPPAPRHSPNTTPASRCPRS